MKTLINLFIILATLLLASCCTLSPSELELINHTKDRVVTMRTEAYDLVILSRDRKAADFDIKEAQKQFDRCRKVANDSLSLIAAAVKTKQTIPDENLKEMSKKLAEAFVDFRKYTARSSVPDASVEVAKVAIEFIELFKKTLDLYSKCNQRKRDEFITYLEAHKWADWDSVMKGQ